MARLRVETRKPLSGASQSRLGPPLLPVMISTTSPLRERLIQRHDPAVDLGAAAAVPELGVHVVGKIERRGAARQVDDFAARRQRVDAIGEQLGLDALDRDRRPASAACAGSSMRRTHSILRS